MLLEMWKYCIQSLAYHGELEKPTINAPVPTQKKKERKKEAATNKQ
jgi:hypothetical protein